MDETRSDIGSSEGAVPSYSNNTVHAETESESGLATDVNPLSIQRPLPVYSFAGNESLRTGLYGTQRSSDFARTQVMSSQDYVQSPASSIARGDHSGPKESTPPAPTLLRRSGRLAEKERPSYVSLAYGDRSFSPTAGSEARSDSLSSRRGRQRRSGGRNNPRSSSARLATATSGDAERRKAEREAELITMMQTEGLTMQQAKAERRRRQNMASAHEFRTQKANELSQLTKKLKDAENRLATIPIKDQEIEQLTFQNEELHTTVKSLEATTRGRESSAEDVEELRSQNPELNSRIGELEATIRDQEAGLPEITELRGQKQALHQQVEELTAENQSLKFRVQELYAIPQTLLAGPEELWEP